MPRKPLFLTEDFPYHVTSRSNNKEWFYLPLEQCWEIFSRNLQYLAQVHEVNLYAFVLMSNHFHLLLSTPHRNLGDVMRDFLTIISKSVLRKTERSNHVFGARHKWSVLESSQSVAYVMKYILRNPIRAGICSNVEDYRYSSIHSQIGRRELPLVSGIGPQWDDVPKDREALLEWLNQPSPKELEKQITIGLRRSPFQFSTSNSSQKAIRQLKLHYDPRPLDDRYLSGPKGD
jgi:putative transposase